MPPVTEPSVMVPFAFPQVALVVDIISAVGGFGTKLIVNAIGGEMHPAASVVVTS